MKSLLSIVIAIVTLAFSMKASAQYTTLTAQNNKSFYKASTVEDTSSTLTIGSYPYVYLHTTTTGSDSSLIYQNFDVYLNSKWSNNVFRDTVTLGRPTGSTLEGSAKGQVRRRKLRSSDGTDLFEGGTQIRIRTKHASGSGDSNAALTYTQKLILRK